MAAVGDGETTEANSEQYSDAAVVSPSGEARTIFKPQKFVQKRGLLVACEGLDGSGKTTIMSQFRQYLEDKGQPTILSNWNDTTEIYNLMMSLNLTGDITAEMRCLFGAIELAARYHYVILPALQQGTDVLTTKYLLSAKAHALVRDQDSHFVSRIYQFALEPDLTIYIDVPPSVALSRKLMTGNIGFWEAGIDLAVDAPLEEALRQYQSGRLSQEFLTENFLCFQSRLKSLHKELLHNSKVCTIDGTLPVEEIVRESIKALAVIE
jgi:dTMP kinase